MQNFNNSEAIITISQTVTDNAEPPDYCSALRLVASRKQGNILFNLQKTDLLIDPVY